jgi:hypothetical protein
MSEPSVNALSTKRAPHEVLVQHFPTQRKRPRGYRCDCGRDFDSALAWSVHALGSVGLDSDDYAPMAEMPDNWRADGVDS